MVFGKPTNTNNPRISPTTPTYRQQIFIFYQRNSIKQFYLLLKRCNLLSGHRGFITLHHAPTRTPPSIYLFFNEKKRDERFAQFRHDSYLRGLFPQIWPSLILSCFAQVRSLSTHAITEYFLSHVSLSFNF